MEHGETEGYPGFTISGIANVPGLSESLGKKPNVILLHAGTNEFTKHETGEDPEKAPERLEHLIDSLLDAAVSNDVWSRATGLSDDDFIAMFRLAGLDVLVDELPPIEDPSLYAIPEEGHPTPLAYKAMAQEIEAHLRIVDPAALETGPR